jgi:Protein of unknown function (DUF2892)
MIYRKNLYTWEQGLRVSFGVILGAFCVFANLAPLPKAVLGSSAAIAITTGFIGFCPACAMVGKKLKDENERKG